jgi:hypothetical protein
MYGMFHYWIPEAPDVKVCRCFAVDNVLKCMGMFPFVS